MRLPLEHLAVDCHLPPMSDPKNHHYVPKMYLKNFATGEGRKASLVAVELETGKLFKPRLRRIASETDFNRIDIDGEDPYAVEKALSAVEGKISPALQEVIAARGFPSNEHRNLLLNLIAMLAVRNPRVRSTFGKFLGDIHEKTLSLMLQSRERWESMKQRAVKDGAPEMPEVDYEDVKHAFQSGQIEVKANKNYLVKLDVDMVEPVLHALDRRKWSFHSALEGNQFVTSDDPVVLDFFDGRERTLMKSPGFGVGGTFVFFALSPDLAIYGPLDAPNLPTELDARAVARINGVTMRYARRHALAQSEDFMLQGNDGSYLTPIQMPEFVRRMSKGSHGTD
jgi:hypothetical protein